MNVSGYALFLKCLEVQARIGIHEFERRGPQRLLISIQVDLFTSNLPAGDHIEGAFDYDWVRDRILILVASRHFDLQETLARAIAEIVVERPEVQRVIVETAKPDVYADVSEVGCRLEARK